LRGLAEETSMTLLVYYVVLVLLLDAVAIAIGLLIEQVAEPLSMPIFLVLFFGSLWLAWIISVRLTEPKDIADTATRPAE
jgi:hypothetical protein